MKNIGNMMKQAQELQKRVEVTQEKINQTEIEGTSGAGLVKVLLNGKGEMRSLKIQAGAVDVEDLEVLEDLIMAAHNDARTKIDDYTATEMSKVTSGLNLPGGLKLPF